VKAIHRSPVWEQGSSAIVIVWDENDYSGSTTQLTGLFPSQNQNRVVLTVETNFGHSQGVQSNTYYNSFSLLRSMESAFGLPCLKPCLRCRCSGDVGSLRRRASPIVNLEQQAGRKAGNKGLRITVRRPFFVRWNLV